MIGDPLDRPIHQIVGIPLREVVLSLWQNRANAGSIMSLCHLTEDELNAIVPKKLWVGHIRTKCHRCNGAGQFSHEVPWPQDDYYFPMLEAAKRNTLSWIAVNDWIRP